MYCIKVDGQVVYSPALATDQQYQIIAPRLHLEIDTAGELTFTMLPGHTAYDSVMPMKSIITVEQDGVERFRGRALQEKVDFYKQKEVYCEGVLSYLLDSVQRPFTFHGTIREYIEQAIASHNAQVEAEKQFTLGVTSALTDETALDLESDGYTDTLSAIRAVLEGKGGYLFTRYENGVLYLDYLESLGGNDGQVIAFGVNLLDLDKQTAAEDLCTVFLPIGGMLEDGTAVTIESVNGGSDTIEDADGIAQHGRIVKAYSFDDVTDPAELLAMAQEKLATMSMGESLTLKAVDMHLVDAEIGTILPGTPVQIMILPHGMQKQDVCTSADLDLENPEEATYTFGKPPETQTGSAAMIANKVQTNIKSISKQWKYYEELDNRVIISAGEIDLITQDVLKNTEGIGAAEIRLDGAEASIQLNTATLNSHGERISGAEVDIDGLNAAILLKADKTVTDELGTRMSQAEVDIDGAEAAIALKADQTTVEGLTERVSAAEIAIDGAEASILLKADKTVTDELGTRLSSAEIAINAANSNIALKADKIDLDGYVTMEDFEALEGTVEELHTNWGNFDSMSVNTITGGTADFDVLQFGQCEALDNVQARAVESMSVSGNTLTITLYDGTSVNFSKASVIALDQTWSGGRLSITTSTSGVTLSGETTATANTSPQNLSWNGNTASFDVTCDRGTIVSGMKVDATSVYNTGWNACRDACSYASNVYTISENAPGTLYMQVNGNYTSVGSSWVKVQSKSGLYYRPDPK